jgi:AcrR family transcriptional regulator
MNVRRGAVPAATDGQTTRELVRSTSTELFAERGFAATTMRNLADRAGLPLSAFYYYFKSKYDVLLAIMDAEMSRLEEGIADLADSSAPPAERLVALVSRHVEVHLADPASARVADHELRSLSDADRLAIVARRDSYERNFRDVLVAGVESGRFARDLDIPLASMAVLTMATSVIDWWRPGGRYTIAETAELIGRYALAVAVGADRQAD